MLTRLLGNVFEKIQNGSAAAADPCRSLKGPLVIPRRRGGPNFSNFQNYFFIARAPGRIRTNPETRVDLIRLRKKLELELKPNSFKN